jgi:ubiquinone/menaquinone biosynthesis C-methylase UbiE
MVLSKAHAAALHAGAPDIPTGETFAFLSAHILPVPRRVLEVGCGDGALAVLIQGAGHEVVALDASPQAVAVARSRGVDARVCHWPQFTDQPFDTVVFNRSLHHMHDLAASLKRARALLKHGGKVLAEDFAFADAKPADVAWLCAALTKLEAAGVKFATDATLVRNVLQHGGSFAGWQMDHDETLHHASEMEAALRLHVGATTVEHVPYLYRYVAAAISDTTNGNGIVAQTLREEKTDAQLGHLTLIGRRFVTHCAA